MRIFKNKPFARFARKAGLDDIALCNTVADAERGLIDADLGGGVLKQRMARPGQGKSGGFRALILYKRATRAVFVYGFSKNERANVAPDEIDALKELARELLAYNDEALANAVSFGTLIEVNCDEKR
jgi:hypothetical protein